VDTVDRGMKARAVPHLHTLRSGALIHHPSSSDADAGPLRKDSTDSSASSRFKINE
jgi:hypothetical protein